MSYDWSGLGRKIDEGLEALRSIKPTHELGIAYCLQVDLLPPSDPGVAKLQINLSREAAPADNTDRWVLEFVAHRFGDKGSSHFTLFVTSDPPGEEPLDSEQIIEVFRLWLQTGDFSIHMGSRITKSPPASVNILRKCLLALDHEPLPR